MGNKINTIYCDFDGTVTEQDAVNTFFEKYAFPEWIEYEKKWVNGEISSMENAIKQVGLLKNITQQEFDEYIKNIAITDGFSDFVKYLKSKNINLVILSDGFDIFIEKTFELHDITNVQIYANHLVYENNSFSIEFPYHNTACSKGAGMCKCSKIKDKSFCYIGDGVSDLCVAKKANILFATKKLNEYCKTNSIRHYDFNNFNDIIKVLNTII